MEITMQDCLLLLVHILILITPVGSTQFYTAQDALPGTLATHGAHICADSKVWSGLACVCAAGFSRPISHEDGCAPCSPGFYKATVDLDLTDDQQNGFVPLPADNVCQSCPSDATSYAGAVSIDECVCGVGFYYDGAKCDPCPVNTFKDYAFDSTSCASCPANTVSLVQSDAPSDCECEPGYEMSSQTAGGLPTCAPCSLP